MPYGIPPSQKGRKRSEETKLKLSISHSGKNCSAETRRKMSLSALKRVKEGRHNCYRGGITEENKKIRQSFEYRLWRTAVYERDNYTCRWCGDDSGGNLQAHHIKPFCDYPELRFAIDNGLTLCIDCHSTTDNYGRPPIK